MIFTGRVWKFGDDINTDLIFPGEAFRMSAAERLRHVFQANRPGWVDEMRPGDIIIGGRNFGTGSSRPGGRLLKDLGISGLVANSINGLFFRNSVNYGFPVLECPNVYDAFEEGDTAEIDLKAGTVKNLRTNQILQGQTVPQNILDLFASGGIPELLKKEGFFKE